VRPINTSALMLDRAAADHASGLTQRAATLFDAMVPTLLDLGEECLAGAIVGGAATDITRLVELAAQVLADSEWQPELTALAERLENESALSDEVVADALASWDEQQPAYAGALAGAFSASGNERMFFLDPNVVPARLLAWHGANAPDLRVTWQPGSDRATVSAALAPSADSRSTEARELIAYAADADGDTVVAIAPMNVQDRGVTATVVCSGHNIERLRFGIYHAASDVTALRLDPAGQTLVMVDRFMRDAFSHHRFAMAAIHELAPNADIEAMESKRNSHLSSAKSAADDASKAIAELLERADVGQDTTELLNRRKAAIDAYRDSLGSAEIPSVGAASLLSELLSAECDED
jgi:hypothetical protein